MTAEVVVERLCGRTDALPVLAAWFKSEWPDWYGPGGPGNAEQDLLAYAHHGSLPVGVVAFHRGALCGVAALKAQSIPSHAHLAPWAAAGFVEPSLRGRGIGAALLAALEVEARLLGYAALYCGTSVAGNLLARAKWRFIESVELAGKQVGVYEKALDIAAPA